MYGFVIKLTCCHQTTCSPLFSPLLDRLKQILAIVVISDQVGTVNYQDQRRLLAASSGKSNLLQFVESALDIKECGSIPRALDTEETADVTVQVASATRCTHERRIL